MADKTETDSRPAVMEPREFGSFGSFGSFGTEWGVPSVFWFAGGTDPDIYAKAQADNRVHEIPTNHSPQFLPVLHPTLGTGVEAMVVAACDCLTA